MNDQRFPGPGNGPHGGAGMVRAMHDGGNVWVHEVFVVVCLAIIVIGVILLAKMLVNRPHSQAQGNWTAVHELDIRYARGEVDRDEYLRRRADLLDPTVHRQPLDPPSPPAKR